MILEFIMKSLTRYEMERIITNKIYCKVSQIKNENNYIINKRCRFNNNTIQIFDQRKIIQKWTFDI